MENYIALLRGINISGQKQIKMTEKYTFTSQVAKAKQGSITISSRAG